MSLNSTYLELLGNVSKEMEDVSSAEEDALRKKRQRELKSAQLQDTSKRTKLNKEAVAAEDPLEPVIRPQLIDTNDLEPLSTQAILEQPIEGPLKLKSMEELLIDHPYMVCDKDGVPVCEIGKGKMQSNSTTATNHKSPVNTTVIRRSTKADSHLKMLRIFAEPPKQPIIADTNPMFHELFKTMFESVPVPLFVRSSALGGSISQEEIDRKLHDKQLFIELMTCGLESELLKESGRWTHEGQVYDFPGCLNDDKCIVMRPDSEFNQVVRHGTRRFKPCSIMTAGEYYELITNHQQPKVRRCCVLCHRYSVTMYVLNARAVRLSNTDLIKQYDSTHSIMANNEPPPVYQLYRNLCDRPDGYHKQFMLLPIQGDCIIEPICRVASSFMTMSIVPDSGGRMMINQEALRWRPPTDFTPQIGESLSHF